MAGDGGLLTGVSLVWHVWRSQMGPIVPKVGDVIQDGAGVRWTVTDGVDVQSFANRYRLQTLKEVVQ